MLLDDVPLAIRRKIKMKKKQKKRGKVMSCRLFAIRSRIGSFHPDTGGDDEDQSNDDDDSKDSNRSNEEPDKTRRKEDEEPDELEGSTDEEPDEPDQRVGSPASDDRVGSPAEQKQRKNSRMRSRPAPFGEVRRRARVHPRILSPATAGAA